MKRSETRRRSAWVLGSLFAVLLAASASAVETTILDFAAAKDLADRGDARAQAIVSMHYSVGWQVAKDPQRAIDYATKSARAGNALGLFRIGNIVRNGEGLPKDEAKGLQLQAKAIELWANEQLANLREGDPYCLLAAGILFFQGKVVNESVEKRRSIAATMYRQAADAGLAPALFNYGMCLMEGYGVVKDQDRALEYAMEAARKQYPPAQKWLLENGHQLPDSRDAFGSSSTSTLGSPSSFAPPTPAAPPPVVETQDPKAREIQSRFAAKCASVLGRLVEELNRQRSASSPTLQSLTAALNPGGGSLSDWLEQSFVAENLEAKQDPAYQDAIKEDRRYAYESAALANEVVPLLAAKQFTDARSAIQRYLAMPGISAPVREAAQTAFKPLLTPLDEQIRNSDTLRQEARKLTEAKRFQEARDTLTRAVAADQRKDDKKELDQIQQLEKKHAFENELGL